jgi:hypothetical protein
MFFVGFSKALARMGGFRIGVGLRLTKKNAIYFLFVLFFVYMARFTWYLIVGIGWLIYYMCYGIYGLFSLPLKGTKDKKAPPVPRTGNTNEGALSMKKPLYKRWYVWAIGFVVFCIIIAPFLPNAEELPSPTPEALATMAATEEPAATALSALTEEPTLEPTEALAATASPAPTEAPTPKPTEAPVATASPAPTQAPVTDPAGPPVAVSTSEPTPIPEPQPTPVQKAKSIGGIHKDENMNVSIPLSEIDKFSVFWGHTGDRVHIKSDCSTFKNGVLYGTLDDARNAERYEWCGTCSRSYRGADGYGGDESFRERGNPNIP